MQAIYSQELDLDLTTQAGLYFFFFPYQELCGEIFVYETVQPLCR